MTSGVYIRTEEHRKIYSDSHKGYIMPEEQKEKIRKSTIGHIVTEKTRQKIRMGHIGKPFSEEARYNMSLAKIGKPNLSIIGFLHPKWKGDKAGYTSIHDWVKKYKVKPIICEKCGETKKLGLSNISGEYKRDVNDYEWLCHLCHRLKDKTLFWSNRIFPSIIKKQVDGR
jgi:hypothetical protein